MKRFLTIFTIAFSLCFANVKATTQVCPDLGTSFAGSAFLLLGPDNLPIYTPASTNQVLTYGFFLTGDAFVINVTECNKYVFHSLPFLGAFDYTMHVWDSSGNFLAGNDDGQNILAGPASIVWNATYTGQVIVTVNSYPCGNSDGIFLLQTAEIPSPNGCPVNNAICDAEDIVLPCGGSGTESFDNLFASADGVSPGPGTNGSPSVTCNATDGWCDLSVFGLGLFPFGDQCVDNDVWFKFRTPHRAGTITITTAGGGGDTQLAIWEDTTCVAGSSSDDASSSSSSSSSSGSSSSSSTACCPSPDQLVKIAANDDDGALFTSALTLTVGPDPNSSDDASSSSSSSSSAGPAPDLIKNRTYWIQVDGFNSNLFQVVQGLIFGPAGGPGSVTISHTADNQNGNCGGSSDDDKWGADAGAEGALESSVTAYPNPFQNTTNISFNLSADTYVTLTVYAMDGKRVANLYDGQAEAGKIYQTTFDGTNLSEGVYMYRLVTSSGYVKAGKLNLTK